MILTSSPYRSILLACAIVASGCADAVESKENNSQAAGIKSVPVGPANSPHQKPAFDGQTRAQAITSETRFEVTTLTKGLKSPWGLAFLPDGRSIVTERAGQIRIVSKQGEIGDAIKGVPAVFFEGQGGLLDIALSPNFAKDRFVYWSFAEKREKGAGSSVARGRLSEDETAFTDVKVIFRQQPSWDSAYHFGSRLIFSPSGHLFITLGDRGSKEVRKLAQDSNTTIGKTVRIWPDGSIPDDNPFVKGKAPAVWTMGHRNIQGGAMHPVSGELWTIEHGPAGGDELNRLVPGKNYGWPVITYGEDYSGQPIGDDITQKPGLEQPLYYFDPVIAPGDMIFYTGELFPQWQHNIFIAAMKEQAVVRLKMDKLRVVGEERLVQGEGRIRDIAQDPAGRISWVTDDGKLRFMAPK